MRPIIYNYEIKISKFNIGDLVVHKRQGYRAVIIDIDPIFQASGRYNPQALKHPFSTRNPWYRLLIDESSQVTYVEEPLLTLDINQIMVNNPFVKYYLIYQSDGYHTAFHRH